jgi:hypothetical protein
MSARRLFLTTRIVMFVMVLSLAPSGVFAMGSSVAASLEPLTGASSSVAGYTLAEEGWMSSILEDLRALGLDADGSGVKVGIVDSGVDPSAVQAANMSEWIDLTSEGRVRLSPPQAVVSGSLVVWGGRSYSAGGVKTVSGRVRVGAWKPPTTVAGGLLGDSTFSVLVADNYLAGMYDSVYVDTDMDGSFSDEIRMEAYSAGGQTASLRSRNGTAGSLTILVSAIEDDGGTVVLGFDGNGHGTAVASIILGTSTMPGVAPKAETIVVKVVDSDGIASWAAVGEGILRASEEGAKVVVVALAPNVTLADKGTQLQPALLRAGKEFGAVVVMAAGNGGPGLGSLPDYADLDNVICVGGYVPSTVSNALGLALRNGYWPWSGIGPTENGGTVTLLAPAIGPAAAPLWVQTSGNPVLFEGTSCSAAYAGGVAALVAQGSPTKSRTTFPHLVKRAMAEGARTIPGLTPVEQGHGILDAARAFTAVRSIEVSVRTRMVSSWGGRYTANGFFDRARPSGRLPVTIDNLSPISLRLSLSTPEWLEPGSPILGVPAVEQRDTTLRLKRQLGPGLHSGWVTGDDPSVNGQELSFLWSTVIPNDMGTSGFFGKQDSARPGHLSRHYVNIPGGLESVQVSLGLRPASNGGGRARMYVYDPYGRLALETTWIGEGTESYEARSVLDMPPGGVWEVVILSDPKSAEYGARDAIFKLELRSTGLAGRTITPMSLIGSKYSCGVQVRNSGPSFKGDAYAIIPGINGNLIEEYLTARKGLSLMKMLPTVEAGTSHLYLAADNLSEPSARANIYLYHLDEGSGKWVEVASSGSGNSEPGIISVIHPLPGRYTAYIEVQDLVGEEAQFRWVAASVDESAGAAILRPVSGVAPSWNTDIARTFTLEIPERLVLDGQRAFVTIWDKDSGVLKAVLPVTVGDALTSPVIQVGQGAQWQEGVALTVKVWDPSTMRPVNALVSLNGIWYQLENGSATILYTGDVPQEIILEAEYPGMYTGVREITLEP